MAFSKLLLVSSGRKAGVYICWWAWGEKRNWVKIGGLYIDRVVTEVASSAAKLIGKCERQKN